MILPVRVLALYAFQDEPKLCHNEKSFSTLILLTAFQATVFSQSCLPEGIVFSTQAQIDNFKINYPNCPNIEGDVRISGADITNLYGLDALASIWGGANNGDIYIHDNPALSSLTSLYNISPGSIANLHICSTPLLSNCDLASIC